MPFTRLNTFTIRDSCALDGLLYGIRNDSRADIEEAIELADLFFWIPLECALGCITLCGTCTTGSSRRLSKFLLCGSRILNI